MVGAGIVGGIGLIIVEIIYHKHKIRRAKRTETAKIAFSRWKGTIEVSLAITFLFQPYFIVVKASYLIHRIKFIVAEIQFNVCKTLKT